jgi:hypothetical protein
VLETNGNTGVLEKGGDTMATDPGVMSNEAFYGYMYPHQNRRYYLALVCSIVIFPVIALSLIVGTIVLIVPLVALLLWLGMRVFFANMLGNSVLVSAENYPRVLAITEEIKANLGYTKPIYIFVYEDGSFNAYMRHLFFRQAIFLNSQLLHSGVSDREVRWIVGRFVGYMRARKQAGFLGWVIRAAQHLLIFNFFILPYERAMVYTGDRLALAEIDGDLSSAIAAMQKLLVGRELGYSINPEGLIAQHRQVKGSIFAFFARMAKGFPHTTARYVELVLFARAFFPEQFKAFEAANPGLPADLAQLGLPQQTDAGDPRMARAPWGWVCACATLIGLLALGSVTWLSVNHLLAEPSYDSRVDLNAPLDAGEAAVAQPSMPPAVSDAAVAPPPFIASGVVASQSMSSTPPNTHHDERGQLVPDQGCRWLNDAPDDFRVVCNERVRPR